MRGVHLLHDSAATAARTDSIPGGLLPEAPLHAILGGRRLVASVTHPGHVAVQPPQQQLLLCLSQPPRLAAACGGRGGRDERGGGHDGGVQRLAALALGGSDDGEVLVAEARGYAASVAGLGLDAAQAADVSALLGEAMASTLFPASSAHRSCASTRARRCASRPRW